MVGGGDPEGIVYKYAGQALPLFVHLFSVPIVLSTGWPSLSRHESTKMTRMSGVSRGNEACWFRFSGSAPFYAVLLLFQAFGHECFELDDA